jgi:hypothetical protein
MAKYLYNRDDTGLQWGTTDAILMKFILTKDENLQQIFPLTWITEPSQKDTEDDLSLFRLLNDAISVVMTIHRMKNFKSTEFHC